MHVTLCTMHLGSGAPPGIQIFRFNRRITYLLGRCPGGPRHDGIDYANSRNWPSWLKPLWNYASTPWDSTSFSLPPPPLSLSLSIRSFNPSLFSFLLYHHHTFRSSFFNLIHPLSSFLPFIYHEWIRRNSRSFAPSPLIPFLLPFGLLCNQNNNNLLRNRFDCSSIRVTADCPWLYVDIDHLVIHGLRSWGRQIGRCAVKRF